MNIVALAGSLPRDPQFREFVAQFVPAPVDIEDAAHFIRAVCQVDSRRQLAEDREAEARFHALLRKPYVAWKEEQF